MKQIAKHLLEIEAVVINNKERFTWASGIKSPIYTDNRLITSYPSVRKEIEAEFAKQLIANFPDVDVIMGTATAGISHAAYISEILDLPMGYVRSSNKKHGKGNQIEGKSVDGLKVVVIEDLLSTGGSSLEAVNTLKEAGANVLGVAAIFKYGLTKLNENFKDIKYFTLTDLDELLDVASENKYIEESEILLVKEFRDNL